MYKKNASGFVHFPVINRTTGEGVTTGTVFATVYHNGAVYSRQSLTPGSNHFSSGFWFYEFTSAAMNSDAVSLGITHTDAIPNMVSINTFIRSTEEIYDNVANLITGVTVAHAGSTAITDVTDFYTPTVGLSTFDPTTDIVSVGNFAVNSDINFVNGVGVTIGDFWATSVGVSIIGTVDANIVEVTSTSVTDITDFYTPTVGLSTFDPTSEFVSVAAGGITAGSIDATAITKIVTGIFDKVVDGSIDFETVSQMLLSWMAGKATVTDNGTNRTITFYRRDGSTSSFEITADETASQEGSRSSTGTIT